ncbi:DgyrCDS11343 [Dimorphilus gyrociliatus]|uniref:DgyrCDS11343 n=1 Tax=Dimorphilus gyrociliatus TaxID=2664684 RepID=A0A7I8W425_9ANNE|nr:DgyrCDS11343 [Dimorphilus gyrociliatus]
MPLPIIIGKWAILYLKGIEEDLKNIPPDTDLNESLLRNCRSARVDCHREVARILIELGRHHAARSHCEQVVDFSPNKHSYYQMGVVFFHINELKKALSFFEKAKAECGGIDTSITRYLRQCEQLIEAEESNKSPPDPRNVPQDRTDRSFSM